MNPRTPKNIFQLRDKFKGLKLPLPWMKDAVDLITSGDIEKLSRIVTCK
jgi:hypothetical protein